MTEQQKAGGIIDKDEEAAQAKLDEDQVNAFYDDNDRKSTQDFQAGTRTTPLGNNVLLMLGRLIQPQTTGFEQVNLDMSFSNLNTWDMFTVRDSSFIINFCKMYGLKKSEYLERGRLATILNSSKSHNGKTMDLFTTTVTTQKQEYKDVTEKKTGFFSGIGPKKKK